MGPSTRDPGAPYDAKGLIISAIENDDLVIYQEHKMLLNVEGEVPEEPYSIPLGIAEVKREGKDLTTVAVGYEVAESMKAAEMVESDYSRVLKKILAAETDGEIECLTLIAIIAEPNEEIDIDALLASANEVEHNVPRT